MNIEDAAKVIYKMMKCDNEEDCAHRSCKECEYFTCSIEEKNAREVFFKYSSKAKNINYDRTGDDEGEKVYNE